MSPRAAWAAIRESVVFLILVTGAVVSTAAVFVQDHQQIQVNTARVDTLMTDRAPQRDAIRAIQLSLCARDSVPLTRALNKCPDSLHP